MSENILINKWVKRFVRDIDINFINLILYIFLN